MRQISLSEAQENLPSIMNTAQQEPVIVKKQDQDYVVIISIKDYEMLVKMKNIRLKQLAQEMGAEAEKNGLTPEILEDILNSES
ncbi:type II toxin-antitoxin system Phd/YefM family antitoxin [Cyanothece sp. BG0011]|uniref:type II toxin-antitoxin system Phd/YefM family antitoxin n=1 Tax=Cyanothece sp. BG0011 TaxID=2082950 RepID=UPI000D1E7C78|nr:type II toxin-antitoxin system Phd/YefM family antitoxin [Cyanothece sp. BG0011]